MIFPNFESAEFERTFLSCFSSFEFQFELIHIFDELFRRFPEPIAFDEAEVEFVLEREEVDSKEQAPYSSIREAITDGTAVFTSV